MTLYQEMCNISQLHQDCLIETMN